LLIIFDLDGTLIDSSRDLAVSTNATRAYFNLPPLEQHVINSYVGNGAAVLMRKAMGDAANEETVAAALAHFLQYYRTHSLEHTRLYHGIREAVDQLSARGHLLAVLTNKPGKISSDILAALGISQRFFCIYGGDSLPNKKPQPDGILRIVEEAGACLPQTLMVGDSKVDIETARNAGVRSCGVSWGFQPETFREAQPDFLVDQPDALVPLIDNLVLNSNR
jgi:phosphoglycolate phosphatase